VQVFGYDSIVRKGQTVHALIRAQGRAAFSVKGIVRFVKKKNNKPTEVGLEFSSLDEIQKNRIMTICEDLSFYIFAR
jgi:c-di-GMP-binding flagellar brake protein YcgR